VLASVHEHTEFVVDSFRNVQPMKLGMHNPWQATIKLPCVADNTCRSVQHSLQSVCNSLRRPGENRLQYSNEWQNENQGRRYLCVSCGTSSGSASSTNGVKVLPIIRCFFFRSITAYHSQHTPIHSVDHSVYQRTSSNPTHHSALRLYSGSHSVSFNSQRQ